MAQLQRLRARAWVGGARLLAIALLGAVVLLAADLGLLNAHTGQYTLDIGTYRAIFFLRGMFEPEAGADGATYRWTGARSTLHFEQARVAQATLLTLTLGGRPTPAIVRLTFNHSPWLTFEAATQRRAYTFALPATSSGDIEIGIESPTFTSGDDPRALGVKLHSLRLTTPGGATRTPNLGTIAAQLALLGAILLLLVYLRWPWRLYAPALVGLALGLAALLSADLLLAHAYLVRLACVALGLLALTRLLLPIAEHALAWAGDAHEIRQLWSLMLLACVIRLAGMLYPTFGGQDLDLHSRLLADIAGGQLVHMIVASEFGNGLVLYPPGTYLTLLPGLIVFSDRDSMLQGTLALLDGATALLVALLARRLAGDRNAARFALLLYAGSTTAFTAMGYGFSAQLFGQMFAAPVALVLMSADPPLPRRTWLVAALLVLMAVSSHTGVAILTAVWVAFALALMLARPHRNLIWAIVSLGVGALFALATLYIEGLGGMLGHFENTRPRDGAAGLPGATPLLLVGLRLAYSGIGLALLPAGLALIAQARRARQPAIVALAWLLTVLLFLAIDVLLGMQVRYFYFFLPMALAAIGIALGRIATRGRAGYAVAWLTVLFVAVQGAALWFSVAFGSGKLSLTPLTH